MRSATSRGTPILVTGAHRSGSTFVGRILSIPTQVGLINEPFSMTAGLDWVDRWYLHLYEGMPEQEYYERRIEDLLVGRARYKRAPRRPGGNGWRGLARQLFRSRNQIRYWTTIHDPRVERPLLKDPLATLSCEFLRRRFGMQVVVLVRHPAAFAASVKRAVDLHWRPFDFENFVSQPALMREYLDPLLAGRRFDELSVVENAALQWSCLYTVLSRFVAKDPSMIVVRHEDLSRNPVEGFRDLFQRLSLPWSTRVERSVIGLTRPGNPEGPVGDRIHSLRRNSRGNIHRWKKVLDVDEVESVRALSGEVADRYYEPCDWH